MQQTPTLVPHRPRVAILLFPDVEVLDWAGPYEVLAGAKDTAGDYCCQVITVAQQPEVQCYGGVRVKPEIRLELCPALDALIVPGGPGARGSGNQETLLRFIREQQRQSEIVASVCTGSFLLARAGLLDGHRATTHHQRRELFRAEFPAIELVEEKVVDEGSIITAGGISSGIDLALYLLQRWFGPEVRRQEARRLEGSWS
ncbi:MAG: DJ-1/PfpI family protein [Herpetosiphonaceae bacterium]|nr:DJ-1/PfpI family protein [Herpetosiphonaceae bacterium]